MVACVWGASLAVGPQAQAADAPASTAAPQPGTVAADGRHLILAPHYGDVVFHHLQGLHFDAISSLMVSQHFQRLSPHDDEAELLRGGLLLSYGLHRDAGDIFARLIDRTGTAPGVRDRAWFYLARARYQRGLFTQAETALGRVQQALPPDLEDDRHLLLAQVLMAQGRYPEAVEALRATADPLTAGARYARFNLGVAQIKSGDHIQGTGTLDALGLAPAQDDEQRALRDRTNVALGFAALRAKQPGAARRYLERVSMDGPESNKALLAYGWAALDLRAPQFALVPWLKLAERKANDAAGLEARIAVPYAYAQLGARGRALQHYASAIRSFTQTQQDIDAATAEIQAGKLVQALLAGNARGGLGEGWHMDQWPDVPHAALLTPLLARNDFQEAFKNLRDLRQLGELLQAWRQKIDAFQDMLATRRVAFAQREPLVDAPAQAERVKALRAKLDGLNAEVAAAQAQDDGQALANARERDLLGRLARAQAIAATLDDAPESQAAKDRVRLLSGLLNWQLAQALPDRLWAAQKSLQGSGAGVQEAELRQASLVQAMADEPRRLAGFEGRIQGLASRIDQALPVVTALAAEQQAAVQALAVAALAQQKDVLGAYLVQARFAVAQLFDHATVDDGPWAKPVLPRTGALEDSVPPSAESKEAADAR
jgi:hypothetical protein